MTNLLFSRRVIVSTILSLAPGAAFAQNSASDALRGLLNQAPDRAPSGGGAGSSGAGLSQNQIGLGLKDALKVASQRVIGRVGKTDGYFRDPAIRIPLPGPLQQVEGPLKAVGASAMLDDLQLKMNRGAEQAAPKALDIFVDAATKMSFDD